MESMSDGNYPLLVFRFQNFLFAFFIKIPKSEFYIQNNKIYSEIGNYKGVLPATEQYAQLDQ